MHEMCVYIYIRERESERQRERINSILYFINFIFILFNIVNTNYTFYSIFMHFYIYSKITKGGNNLNNIDLSIHLSIYLSIYISISKNKLQAKTVQEYLPLFETCCS